MESFLAFLVEYGYIVVFAWVALDQAGLPLPAVPVLLAAGAMAATGELSLPIIIALATLASVPIDWFWFELGRRRGGRVLLLLCAISLEPDYCVRNTEATFARLGKASLLIAKFVPGLQTIAPPMAGMTGMPLGLFLLLDTAGALIWAGLIAGIGFAFGEELTEVAGRFGELGTVAGLIVGGALLAWVAFKFVQRRLFLRTLRMRRLTPEEVRVRMGAEPQIHVIDLRHQYDVELLPKTVPGALRIPMEFIDQHAHEIPKDSDIILYCS